MTSKIKICLTLVVMLSLLMLSLSVCLWFNVITFVCNLYEKIVITLFVTFS